jgi:Ca-activated chloride channel family protein
VGETDNLEVAISNYYEKISSPILSDLKVDISGIDVKDVYPRILPDLFKGSQLVVVGQYQGDGPVNAALSGKVGDKSRRFVMKSQSLSEDESCDFLARLWATRRIGYLLEEIRLHGTGDELVDEVRRLGIKFGIVTPYTSFLVTEKERATLDAAAPAAEEALSKKQVTGRGAVQIAKATQQYKAQDRAEQVVSQMLRYKGDKTFMLKDGLWVDSVYVEGSSVKEIAFGSDEYFRLIDAEPGISLYLSVATNVLVSYKGSNYKITE